MVRFMRDRLSARPGGRRGLSIGGYAHEADGASSYTRFMETVSEKRGRGRPRAFSDEALAPIRALHPEVKTRRGLLNIAYSTLAIGLVNRHVEGRPVLTHIFSADENRVERRILTEIGRALLEHDEDVVVEWAVQAAELRADQGIPVADVAEAIRRVRLHAE